MESSKSHEESDMTPVFLGEAAILLSQAIEKRKECGDKINDAIESMLKFATLQSKNISIEKVEHIRNALSSYGLSLLEMVQLVNLAPEIPEDAKAYVPSLCRISDTELERILDEIQAIMKNQ